MPTFKAWSRVNHLTMNFSGNNFRHANGQRYRRSLTAAHLKSTPKASAKSSVSDQRLLFRRLFSRLIQEISWIGTRATTSSWTHSFLPGSERRVLRSACAIWRLSKTLNDRGEWGYPQAVQWAERIMRKINNGFAR